MSTQDTSPAVKRAPTNRRDRAARALETAHATARLEHGPVGVIARVEHDRRGTDYAGPLPGETVDALREVAE